ncbi:MAG: penicillin-binding protein [Oscillospiraceae bacterium]|jgi:peptidoglycan glycosyltransferase|nr:penicillin-binding protein [Oscillospiraceae bacterium]
MYRINKRALSVLVLVLIAILGMLFYIGRFLIFGGEWATSRLNPTVQSRGMITDRNGVELAGVTDGKRTFAEDANVRRATLHAVGDREGNIGIGALRVYAPNMAGYNFIAGLYSRTGAGNTVALSIDSNLNVEAMRALDGRKGTVIVSNYLTGEVLCMFSSPTFDPIYPPHIDTLDDEEGVYLNRAIQAAYIPGSIFKLVTAAAAIETFDDVYRRTFVCTGAIHLGEDTVTCPSVHGDIDIVRGMRVSCNIVFCELALDLGADILSDYTARYDLSGRTKVGGIQTMSGNFDKAEPNTADLAWSGIGQYNNMVNPATMLRFVSAIANDGNAVELQLRKKSTLFSFLGSRSSRLMSAELARDLGDMIEIQNRDNFPGLLIHAKTGTAQVGGDRLPHAWYVGYITNPGYPLAFVVIVENSGTGSSIAAPIANRVLQAAIKN